MTKTDGLEGTTAWMQYRLRDAELIWDRLVAKIWDNPNQMNVYGVWMREFLHDLMSVHAIVVERDQALRDAMSLRRAGGIKTTRKTKRR